MKWIPTYGNWGGPGWSAGTYPNSPEATDWAVPAVDSMDALFKEHDRQYQEALLKHRSQDIPLSTMFLAWHAADNILLYNLHNIGSNPKKWKRPAEKPWRALLYMHLAIIAFSAKEMFVMLVSKKWRAWLGLPISWLVNNDVNQ